MTEANSLQKNTKLKLTKIIDNIVDECKNLESPSHLLNSKTQEYNSKISLIYEKIRSENFRRNSLIEDPTNFYQKNRLKSCLQKKEKVFLTVSNDLEKCFKNSSIAKASPETQLSHFTFEKITKQENFQILLKNKRGFGKNWKNNHESFLTPKNLMNFDTFPEQNPKSPKKLFLISLPKNSTPSALKSPKNNLKASDSQVPMSLHPLSHKISLSLASENSRSWNKNVNRPLRALIANNFLKLKPINSSGSIKIIKNNRSCSLFERKNGKIWNFVEKLLEKNLGIKKKLTINDKILKKTSEKETFPEKQKNSEDWILNSEYIKYNSDTENKLKIQKILVAKHLKQRRLQLSNFPLIKKLRQDDEFNYY